MDRRDVKDGLRSLGAACLIALVIAAVFVLAQCMGEI
jgi:hypothetical protein